MTIKKTQVSTNIKQDEVCSVDIQWTAGNYTEDIFNWPFSISGVPRIEAKVIREANKLRPKPKCVDFVRISKVKTLGSKN